MSERPTPAETLDAAVDELLRGRPPAHGDASIGALVGLAREVRAALVPPGVSPRFEARLGTRLAGRGPVRPTSLDQLAWVVRHPGRLLVTGAVGSAAVGVGVTAFAVWRRGRGESTMHRMHR